MGKKDGAKKKDEEEVGLVNNAAPAPKEEEEEDTPVIKSLKELDDKYCAAELAMEREVEKLRKKYVERQAPLLLERSKILNDASASEEKDNGTPGCPNFWLEAMTNADQFEEVIHDCDHQVLKFLKDVKSSQVDPECEKKGCRLEFTFAENPFFTNTVLFTETCFDYDLESAKPWKEPDCIEVKSSTIDWKAGKNVTMAKKAAEVSKKGKKKPSKSKEEPCPSFFRILFTSTKKADEDLPEELQCIYQDMGAEDEDEMLEMHLENVGELLGWMHSEFVPYAIRFFTGEACHDMGDSDEESEEESSVEDSDEESDEPAPKKGGKKSPQQKPKQAPGGGAEKTEECKQQ